MSECRLILGDCLSVFKTLESGSVDAVITDPPYSSGGAFRGDRMNATSTKYEMTRQIHKRADFAGDNRDQRAYGYWCALWLSECLRVVKPGGVCCLFTDWRQLPTTTDALQSGGWMWRGIAVWDKTEAARPAKGRYRNQCEYLVWGSSGPMKEEGPCLPGVWRQSNGPTDKHHTAGKPLTIMRQIVEICAVGETVLDPFMGSGTTGLACLETGRNFIGVEISGEHFNVAEKRIEKARIGGPIFKDVSDLPSGLFEKIAEKDGRNTNIPA